LIYFIQAEEIGHIKIGFTGDEDSAERLRALQTGSPVRLQLLGEIPGDELDERTIHQKFAAARVNGEWFRAIPQLRQFISARLRGQGIDCALMALPPEKKLLKPSEVAARLGTSTEHVLGLINRGRIKSVNIGHGSMRPRHRITEEALDQFIAMRTKDSTPIVRRRKHGTGFYDGPQYV
jgi:excisionase family DNA binding protein